MFQKLYPLLREGSVTLNERIRDCMRAVFTAVADPEEVHGVPQNPPFSHVKPRIAC